MIFFCAKLNLRENEFFNATQINSVFSQQGGKKAILDITDNGISRN